MSSANIHLTPEQYERLMAKRKAEREAAKRPDYFEILGAKTDGIEIPRPKKSQLFESSEMVWNTKPILPPYAEKLRGFRVEGNDIQADVANMWAELLDMALEKKQKKIPSSSVLGLLGPSKPYQPRSPRKPPIVGRHGDMNKTEARFLSDVLHGEARFEAVTLKLEGGSRYTPDFVTREEGVTVFYEVKGSFRLGSEGRAHTAFYEAASQFPWCRFVWAVLRKGGKWDLKTVDPAI